MSLTRRADERRSRQFESGELRVAHLSDLHAVATEGDQYFAQERVARALVSDLQGQAGERAVDIIVFSGDLSYDGSEAALRRGREILLDPLRGAFPGIPILSVPGNHDVERARIDKVVELGLAGALTDRESVVARLADQGNAEQARSRLAHWDRIAAEWEVGAEAEPLSPGSHRYRLQVNGLDVAIGAFDSAWRAKGGVEDKGQLIVGVDFLEEFLRGAEGADLRLVVFHHPVDWLIEFDRQPALGALERAGALVLTGHEHRADPSLEMTTRGAALHCRTSSSFDSVEHPNGYAIIDIDPSRGETKVALRRWQPENDIFGPDTVTGEQAVTSFPWPVREGQVALPLRLSDAQAIGPLAAIAQEHSVLAETIDAATPDSVSDVAVAPRYWPIPHSEVFDRSADRGARPNAVDPLEVLGSNRVAIVSGPNMSGVSTSLLWILEAHFRRVGTHVPAYVQSDPRFSLGRINRTIAGARERAGGGPVLVAVDDVAPADKRALGRLIRLVDQNPEVTFVFGCHGEDHAAVARALQGREIASGDLYLGPFGRRELRALVARIVGAEGSDLVGRVLDVIHRQRLPRNPLNVAALISVMVREPNLTAINESGLLQSYVGVLLDNPAVVDPEGLNMDYRRREHLLQEIARHCVEKDLSRIPRLDLEELVIDYFRSIGYQAGSAGQQVDGLIRRRVLAQDESGVGFRYPALLYLFAAKAASEDPEFEAMIFADMTKYAPVIKHVAGLKRNDAEILARVAEHARAVRQEATPAVEVEQFDLITDEYGWSRVRSLEHARELVRRPPEPPSESELDEIYDEVVEEPADAVEPRPFAGENPQAPVEELGVAFSLLASVLQSSELVRDLELRRGVLGEVIDGWSAMTVLFALEEDMFRSIHELIEPLFDGGGDPERRKNMVEHVARLFIVNLMSVNLYVEAGTIHHERILAEILDDPDFMAKSADALLGTMLYMMLGFPGWPGRLAALLEAHGDHPMVRETVRIWAQLEYHRGKLSETQSAAVEEILVELLTPEIPSGGRSAVPARAAQAAELREGLRKGRTAARWAAGEADAQHRDAMEREET